MKKLFSFLILLLIFNSCDDGDIIITGFEFDETDLQLCKGSKENEFVFFKINQTINESISYNFIHENFSDTIATSTAIIIELNDNNSNLLYRKFNTKVTNNYFCGNVPSNEIRIIEELIAIKGISEISTKIIAEDDNDGIPAEQEDLNNNGNLDDDDTDKDGIPNYKDQDDDNDNILTSVELPNEIPGDDSPRDTDGDKIPDYLDDDDDNDKILTRNEDANKNGNPRDDTDPVSGKLFYLDSQSTNKSVDVDINPNNTVQTTFRTTVSINNLIFDRSDQNFKDKNFSFGFRDITIPKKTKKK
ncbi:hypothetical protein [Aquimarina longa]|uniref:hypothetical protein n=1 Tax=Aquimarina longa TaxID=1080221 RepID=UPI0007808A65|nr:hypothetical protein [Aquimarina longa]